jgi:uncharacterized integral membrane protein (TIGR00697 family)
MNKNIASRDNSSTIVIITAIFVAVQTLLPSTASKFVAIGPLNLPGSSVIFPINYIFNDVLTEVYGYERSRRIIWLGFGAQILAAATYTVIQYLPPSPFWHNQAAYETIFAQAPRLVLASLAANFTGEFANSFVVSWLKFRQHGRRGAAQAMRFVGSTVVGQLVNSVVFLGVGFYGTLPLPDLVRTILTMWAFKVVYEIVMLPLSLRLSNWLKARESIDVIDVPAETRYSPFHF